MRVRRMAPYVPYNQAYGRMIVPYGPHSLNSAIDANVDADPIFIDSFDLQTTASSMPNSFQLITDAPSRCNAKYLPSYLSAARLRALSSLPESCS